MRGSQYLESLLLSQSNTPGSKEMEMSLILFMSATALSHTHEFIPGKEQSMMLRAWSSALRLMQHHNLQEPKHNPTVD
jgi:hypothetical protein